MAKVRITSTRGDLDTRIEVDGKRVHNVTRYEVNHVAYRRVEGPTLPTVTLYVLSFDGVEMHDLDVDEVEIVHDQADVVRRPAVVTIAEQDRLRRFAGYLTGALPELHGVEVPRIAAALEQFLVNDREG